MRGKHPKNCLACHYVNSPYPDLAFLSGGLEEIKDEDLCLHHRKEFSDMKSDLAGAKRAVG